LNSSLRLFDFRRVVRCIAPLLMVAAATSMAQIGHEGSVYERLEDGDEYRISTRELIRRGELAFRAQWTPEEGGGRPYSKGTGASLSDHAQPLVFPNNFNRLSAMDANSCAGCHNAPFGITGGGGDFVTGVFVAAQRFDFATLDYNDGVITRGALDEQGAPVSVQTIGNFRATVGMFGAGFIEMLARQMTLDLQAARDATAPGGSRALSSKGVGFGSIARAEDGSWDVSQVEGLPPQSLATTGPGDPPSLVIRPFHQSGTVVSLREFTNNAFNHHHGMQSVERFGYGVDADGDGIVDELTRADITAVSVFQATLPVPGQVIPNDPAVREAIDRGFRLFREVGCAGCHVPALPLVDQGWVYTEPNPFNPPGNLQPGDAEPLRIDLTSSQLPGRRLKPRNGVVWVPAFTDLKLHDITSGPGDPNEEPIDINRPPGSAAFFAGNRRFLTKKLWGAANQKPFFHHGKFTTLREATLAHHGDALESRQRFEGLSARDQDAVIEFLKSLQVEAPRGAAEPLP
jgi:hypothetical protein